MIKDKIINILLLWKRYLVADSFLKNKKAKYLVYTYNGHFMGLMSKMLTVLGWLDFAEKNNMELVVDIIDGALFDGNGNAWEYYYEQPMIEQDISHKEVTELVNRMEAIQTPAQTRFHYKFYRVAKPIMKLFPPTITFPMPRDHKTRKEMQKRFSELYKRYIRTKPNVTHYIEDEYAKILLNKGKVLGVLCRGTDYVQRRPEGHPIQPQISDVIQMADRLQNKYNWDYIYLATDEKKTEQQFNEHFPGKVLINKRHYLDGDYSDKYLCDVSLDRENDQYYRDLEYLSSMTMLSRCSMFIGGYCGGSQAVLLMNHGNFEFVHLFDLGDY